MESKDHSRLSRHLFLALRPIAKLLLASGINYRIFSEAAKRAFVDVAVSDYGIRARPANTARVAIITGLTRKDVKRLREYGGDALNIAGQQATIPSDVLHHWHTDSAYISPRGNPREIPYAGPNISFVALVRQAGADISPAAVLAELKRMSAVVELPSGLLQARQRYYVPADLEDLVAEGLRFGVSTIAGTIAFNAVAKRDGDPVRRFQRVVESGSVPEALGPNLKQFLERKLLLISEQLDDEITNYADPKKVEPHPEPKYRRIGVGLYYFEED